MTYTPTAWVNGSAPPINAVNLGKIEAELVTLDTSLGTLLPNPVIPLGGVGDDSTDDYAALQAVLSSAAAGSTVQGRRGAVYRLSNSLTPPSGVTVDFNGAGIRAGASRSGTLASNDQLINLTSKTNVAIRNGQFLDPASSFAGAGERSLILIDGGSGNIITRCSFTATSGGHTAVRLRNGANDCEVSYNALDGYGIMYAQARDSITGAVAAGTSRTRCLYNRIINAPIDGLKALGNGLTGVYNDDCQVIGNIIINAGRMGIEDYNQCRGTIIANNMISVTGVITPSVGIGISAVASNSTVQGNTVKSPATFGIEVGSSGSRVIGNSIDMGATTNVALSVDSEGKNSAYGALVEGNVIKGGSYGIRSASANPVGSVVISSNHIYDWSNMGIDCAAVGMHIIVGNTLQQSTPNNGGITRIGINGGTGSPVISNSVLFRSSAGGGANIDKLCQLFRDNQIVCGNTFDAGGVTSPAIPTVNAAGGAPTDITVMNNVFTGGAALSVSTITRPRVAHNVGLATIGGTPTLGFFNATPVAKPTITGSRGGSSALADLLTDLASLGLITDSTTEELSPAFFPLYKSGFYYYCNSAGGNSTSNTLTNNQARVSPFVITKSVSIIRIGAEFTAAGEANSVFHLGIWADDGTGVPGAVAVDAGSISTGTGNAGTVATGGTPGVYEITVSATLAPGLYWAGGAVQGAATTQPTMRTVNATGIAAPVTPGSTIPGAGGATAGFQMGAGGGALPTWSGTGGSGSAVRIFFKVA